MDKILIKSNFEIDNIPTVLWGKPSGKLIIAVHGNMSGKEDKPIAIPAGEAAGVQDNRCSALICRSTEVEKAKITPARLKTASDTFVPLKLLYLRQWISDNPG